MTPILSICIPTYHRANLLELALSSLAPQVEAMHGEVELIVADNCSPDHTQEVVGKAQQYGSIRYYRNPTNIGFARNILLLTNELASGEFCWIVGDDDMIVQGKVAKVVNLIKSNRDLDYFFVNYFSKFIDERNDLISHHNSAYIPRLEECMCQDLSDYRMQEWDNILGIDTSHPSHLFTAITCHIFRRLRWVAYTNLLNLDITPSTKDFSTFDLTFPHITIIAHAMIGRPVFYIGDPCILVGIGSQEWRGFWPAIHLVYLHQALDLYEDLGASKEQVRRRREDLLRESGSFVVTMLTKPDTPGREIVSLTQFFRRFWKNRTIRESLIETVVANVRMRVVTTLPHPIYLPLRATWRLMARATTKIGVR